MRLYVTDHAVIRYMERVLNIDVEKLRADIRDLAARGTDVPVKTAQRAIMSHNGKAAVILDEHRVVTVIGQREMRRAQAWIGLPIYIMAEAAE